MEKEQKKKVDWGNVTFLFFMLLAIANQITSPALNSLHAVVIKIGSFEILVSSIIGIFTAINSLSYVIMVCLKNIKGLIVSYILTLINVLVMVQALIMTHNLSPLPGIINAIIAAISITVIYLNLKRITKNGATDMITGLLNRRGFVDNLNKRLKKKKKQKHHLIHIHVKNVRAIVNNYGYGYADIILKEIGKRIQDILGKDALIAKIEGNEYLISVSEENPEQIANNIIEVIEEKFDIVKDGIAINGYFQAYAGVASYPEDANSVEQLLRCAGIAIFRARTDSKVSVKKYSIEMEERLHYCATIESYIREALDKEYFYLVYQPQFYTSDKKLRGLETLIRLKFPDGKFVSPGEFIPIAENSDLILKIDDYVLNMAMKIHSEKLKKCNNPYVISINVSAKNMTRPDFVDKIRGLIQKYDFPENCLEIEITEYSFSESKEQTIKNVNELREMGVMVALDDFGTGYTSLSDLLNIPVNLLKIDKSLIDGIVNSAKNRDFVDSVIYMGHLMNCEVISEGVEDQGQLDILKEYKCDFIQGYIWGKPMELDKAMEHVQ